MKAPKKHAIHEAAHAVYAWYHGGKICDLSIIGPRKEGGSPYFCSVQAPGMLPLDQLTCADVLFRIGLNLAPYAAFNKLYGDVDYGERADVIEAINFMTWNKEALTLYKSAKRAINNSNSYKEEARHFYDENKSHVESFINEPQIIKTIKLLASKLSERGRLSGMETVSFIEKKWKGCLPLRAKPASEHPTGVQPKSYEATVSASCRLCKMALEIMHDYRPENQTEETNVEKGIKELIHTNLKLSELLQK